MKSRTFIALATATSAMALGAGVTAATAADYVYYSSASFGAPSNLGRVQVDGTGLNDDFAAIGSEITGLTTYNGTVYLIAGAQNARKLWRVAAAGTATQLGAASLCATAPNSATDAQGIAVANDYIYYFCEAGPGASAARYLARASLDGATRIENFSTVTGTAQKGIVASPTGSIAYFPGTTGFGGPDRVYMISLAQGSTPSASTSATTAQYLAPTSSGIFWSGSGAIGRFAFPFPALTSTTLFSPTGYVGSVAADSSNVYWVGGSGMSLSIYKGSADGTGSASVLATSSKLKNPSLLAVGSGASSGGGSTPTDTPSTPGAPKADSAKAALVRPATTAPAPAASGCSNCVAVTVPVQLSDIGNYTFIFERSSSSNEMAREAQVSGSRVPMQKGTRIGKRKLVKTYSAVNVTTTTANAKVVTVALLKKAQAKNLKLRVIKKNAGGALTQSVLGL